MSRKLLKVQSYFSLFFVATTNIMNDDEKIVLFRSFNFILFVKISFIYLYNFLETSQSNSNTVAAPIL